LNGRDLPTGRQESGEHLVSRGFLIKHIMRMNKKVFFYGLVVIFLLLIFAVKVLSLDYPITAAGGDGSRDYLVGHHIVTYKEFPLIGPLNVGAGGLLYNSPLYYYLIAAFLLVSNNIISLEIISLFLWFIGFIFIYILARHLYGSGSAFLAIFFLGLASITIGRSDLWHASYIWQPYIMQPFLHLGLLLLFLSYKKRNFKMLLSGLFFFIFAAVLHNSVLGLLPIIIVITLLILKRMNAKKSYYIRTLLMVFGSVLLFYSSVFIYLLTNPHMRALLSRLFDGHTPIYTYVFVPSLFDYFNNIYEGIRLLPTVISSFVPFNVNFFNFAGISFMVLIFVGTIVYFFAFQKNKERKFYTIIITLAVIGQFMIMYLLKNPYTHYFIPVTGILFMGIGEVVYTIFSKNKIFKVGGVLLLSLFIYGFFHSPGFFQVRQSISQRFSNFHIIQSATDAITDEIFVIQRDENFKNIHFFQIQSYRAGSFVRNAVLWASLEEALDEKFTTLQMGKGASIAPITDNDYIFLACYEYNDELSERKNCINPFLGGRKNYDLVKKVYSHELLSIYSAKRQ